VAVRDPATLATLSAIGWQNATLRAIEGAEVKRTVKFNGGPLDGQTVVLGPHDMPRQFKDRKGKNIPVKTISRLTRGSMLASKFWDALREYGVYKPADPAYVMTDTKGTGMLRDMGKAYAYVWVE
jgi:hypothetical protein